MRYTLALTSMTAIAAAAPMKTAGDNWYSNYNPYKNYGVYPKAVEDLAAKMQADAMPVNMKRNAEMGFANDINYKWYASYKPYTSYGPYSAAVDEAAVKMDMEKRDMENAHTAETAKLMAEMKQRDTATMADNNAYATYPSYPSYDPYGRYPAAVEHAADAMQKRHDMRLDIPDPAMTDRRDVMHAGCRNGDGDMAGCVGEEGEAGMGEDKGMMGDGATM